MAKAEKRILGGEWLYAQLGVWKWSSTYYFRENLAYFVETQLKDSTFWWVACFIHICL